MSEHWKAVYVSDCWHLATQVEHTWAPSSLRAEDGNKLTDEDGRSILIQKLTDKGGGLNDLGILANLAWLYNILLASLSVNFDSILAKVGSRYQFKYVAGFIS